VLNQNIDKCILNLKRSENQAQERSKYVESSIHNLRLKDIKRIDRFEKEKNDTCLSIRSVIRIFISESSWRSAHNLMIRSDAKYATLRKNNCEKICKWKLKGNISSAIWNVVQHRRVPQPRGWKVFVLRAMMVYSWFSLRDVKNEYFIL
jgi:hypothetical protein